MMDEPTRKRMNELCERVMAETDPDTLTVLMRELDALYAEYMGNPPPIHFSIFAEDAERICHPTETDLQWARQMVTRLKHGGTMMFPDTGLIYQIDRNIHTVTLQNVEQLYSFPSFIVHLQTIEAFRRIGYIVNERED